MYYGTPAKQWDTMRTEINVYILVWKDVENY